jgi:hypothetical protein
VATEEIDTAATTNTEHVTLADSGAITWDPAAPQDGKAAYATEYTATVTATADDNYAFADDATATVNGETATVTKNDDGTLSIAYTFSKTALTPVTITATDKEVTYSADGIAIPVDDMFAITEGAGAATYSVTNGTGEGTYDAQTGKLTVTKCGTFTVKVSTATTETYAAGAETTATLTVNKADSTAATVTANSRTYDGTEQPLVTVTGTPTGGTMQYALGTATEATEQYTTSIPAKTNAGTYYVWYKVKGDDNHNDSTPACVSVTIADPVEAVKEMINALPAATVVTITDKDAIEAARAAYDALTDDQKKQISKDILKKLTDAEDKLVVLQTISEVTAKTGSDVIYTGKPVQLVNTPTTALPEGYSMKYAVTTENKAPAEESLYDASVPTAVNGGTYYVWYFVTNGQVKTEVNSLTVTIVPVKDNTVTVTLNGWVYGEEPNTPVATAAYGADTATFSYSTEEEGTYTEDVPTIPGTYYVKATILETVNYNGAVSAPVKFVIEKGNQEAPAGLKVNRIKPGTATGVISGVDDTMEYSVDGGKTWTLVTKDAKTIEGLSAGEVLVRRAETTNYKASESVKVVIVEYSTELTVYFAEGTESGTEQYVTYNEKERRYEHTFTGENICPAIVVEGGGKFLTEGVDYSVSYTNNKNCSTGKEEAKVKVTGKGDYEQTKTISFTIVKAQLSDKSIVASGMIVKESQKIEPALYFNGYKLKTSDYKVTSSTGKMTFKTTDKDPSLTFTGKGNFEGTLTLPVTVIGKKDKKPSIKVTLKSGTKRTYNGEPQTLTVTTGEKAGELTVKSGDTILKENSDFVVSYSSNINAGTVTATVNGIGSYTGSSKKTFKIQPDTNTAAVESSFADGTDTYAFRKEGVTPSIVVTAKRGEVSTILTEGIDYRVSYTNNKKVGTKAAYSVTFLGNYKGRKAITGKTFKITASDLTEADIVVGDKTKVVTSDKDGISASYKSETYVSIGNVKLTKGTDYTVEYYLGNQLIKGDKIKFSKGETFKTITVKIKGKGNYASTVEKTATYNVYKVIKNEKAIDISKARIVAKGTKSSVKKQKYTGIEIRPEIEVQIKQKGKWVSIDPSLYNVSYVNNVRRGTASIVVNGNGTETLGSKKANFNIVKSAMKDAKGIVK